MDHAKIGLAMLVCALAAAPSCAGTGSGGYISQILTQRDGTVFIYYGGTHNAAPSCASIPQRWAINGATPAGQVLVASAMSAYSMHASVYINGANDCAVASNTESVDWIVYPG